MDNGCEFTVHIDITKGLSGENGEKVTACFTDSYSSWQKGTVEDANKLLRKYISKKADVEDFIGGYVEKVQHRLNER